MPAGSGGGVRSIAFRRRIQSELYLLHSAVYTTCVSVSRMVKKKSNAERSDDLRAEYDLGKLLRTGVQGKYAERFREGTNFVLLAPDVADAFPTAESVNEALRLVLQLTELGSKKRRPSRLTCPRIMCRLIGCRIGSSRVCQVLYRHATFGVYGTIRSGS